MRIAQLSFAIQHRTKRNDSGKQKMGCHNGKHNRSSFDVMITRRNHQKYKRRMEQLRVNWDSSQWIGAAVIMTSPKFGAKLCGELFPVFAFVTTFIQ